MSRLVIDRLNAECVVPRQHPHPELVRMALDDALARLQSALAECIERLWPSLRDGVWCIRRLDLDLAVDLSRFDTSQLSRLLGERLAVSIATLLRRPPDGTNVLYFADRAHYVAHYVADRARGRAAQHWYYQPFEGLTALSTSQAIREAIVREQGEATAPAILQRLWDAGAIESVLAALTEADAERVYLACVPGSAGTPAPDGRGNILQLARIWPRAGVQPRAGYGSAKNRLRVWLAWRAQAGGQALSPQQEAARHETIRRWLPFLDIVASAADANALLQHVAAGRYGEASKLARQRRPDFPVEHLPVIHAIAGGDAAWLHQAVQAFAPVAVAAAPQEPASARIAATACSGLFLLLPSIVALDLPRLLAEHAPSEEAARIWRTWLALKCLGGRHMAEHLADPSLLHGLALPSPPGEPEWSAVAEATNPQICDALARGLLQRLQTQSRITGEYVALSASHSGQSAPVHVLHDMPAGYWLDVTASDPEAALRRLSAILAQEPVYVWRVGDEPPSADPLVADFARRHPPVEESLAYYALDGLPQTVDHTFSLLADAVLRCFARRLMGFAWSSPDHLHRNFLSGTGQLRVTPSTVHVTLPPVPLLSVIMMAGMHRDGHPLPWSEDGDGTEVTLEAP